MATSTVRPKGLAFSRAINVSEGKMFQTTWENRFDVKPDHLTIKIKNSLGTKPQDMSDKAVETEASQPNPKAGQSCALDSEKDTLMLIFYIKILPVAGQIQSCSDENYQKYLNNLFICAKDKDIFYELAQLYVNNIANGRFLWRNRRSASHIETIVWVNGDRFRFNSKDFQLDEFVYNNKQLNTIARAVADAFAGNVEFLNIKVESYACLNNAMEVFPSQELTIDGDKSKILFEYEGSAGIHSQKIGNAIRTIDIWYPDYGKYGFALPVEPYGVKRSLGLALRKSTSFYKLIDKYITDIDNASKEDLLYIMAVIIRGGMFGSISKENSSDV